MVRFGLVPAVERHPPGRGTANSTPVPFTTTATSALQQTAATPAKRRSRAVAAATADRSLADDERAALVHQAGVLHALSGAGHEFPMHIASASKAGGSPLSGGPLIERALGRLRKLRRAAGDADALAATQLADDVGRRLGPDRDELVLSEAYDAQGQGLYAGRGLFTPGHRAPDPPASDVELTRLVDRRRRTLRAAHLSQVPVVWRAADRFDRSFSLPSVDFDTLETREPGLFGGRVSLEHVASEETTQGVVYAVRVFMPGARRPAKSVDVVLKRSLVVPAEDYVRLMAGVRQWGPDAPSTRAARELVDFEYGRLDNPAYVDAVLYWLLGLLNDAGFTRFTPLIYGSARARLATPPSNARDTYGRPIARPSLLVGAPVQMTLVERLGPSLCDLAIGGFFLGGRAEGPGRGPGFRSRAELQAEMRARGDWTRALAALCQVTAGLAVLQWVLGFHHNDLHCGNVLSRRVDPDSHIYLRIFVVAAGGGLVRVVHLRVPLCGRELVAIDPGRSTVDIDGVRYGASTSWEYAEGRHDLFNDAGDLLRLVVILAPLLASTDDLRRWAAGDLSPPSPSAIERTQFARAVMWIAGDGRGSSWFDARERLAAEADREGWTDAELRQRERLELFEKPWDYGSPYTHGTPAQNLRWFGRFAVDAASVPSGVPLYDLVVPDGPYAPRGVPPFTSPLHPAMATIMDGPSHR